VHGFLEVVRDTLRKEVWPDHGDEQGEMTIYYPQCVREKRSLHIDASKERYAMTKGGECKAEGAQVGSEHVYIKDNIIPTSHIHKRVVQGKEASGSEIEDCCEEGEHCDGGQDISKKKRQELKRKATEVVDVQQSPKGQRDVYSQSGSKEFRFTELIVQEHEVTVRVPRYVVSRLEHSEEEVQNFEWILGVVQMSYIEEQSNARMYDVLFADEIRKCIPSGFTKQILRHEKCTTQHTKNIEPMCNI
jgi:hypothetical protein